MSFWQVSGTASIPTPPVVPVLYAAKGGSSTTSDLYTLDEADGAATSVGPIGFAMTGLAFRPSDHVLFGVTNNNSASNPRSLITIDPVTGTGTLVGALGVSSGLADIAFRASDDALFGYTQSTRTLYSVDTTTGTATQVSATAIPGGGLGYGDAFDSADVLYVMPEGANGVFYIVDPSTGGLTVQTALSGTFTNDPLSAASFDTDNLMWVLVQATGPVWHLATVDVGASTITDVGVTESTMDALAWSLV